MKYISEKTYHALFLAGLAIKAIISIGEVIAGLVFAFLSYDTIYKIVFLFFGGELTENPRDLIWGYFFRAFQGFSNTPQAVWAFIFLSHGIVKLFLLGALWKNKLWAYPTSAIIFTLFIFYQLYQILLTPSIILWIITIIDMAVVILIVHEYKELKKRLQSVRA